MAAIAASAGPTTKTTDKEPFNRAIRSCLTTCSLGLPTKYLKTGESTSARSLKALLIQSTGRTVNRSSSIHHQKMSRLNVKKNNARGISSKLCVTNAKIMVIMPMFVHSWKMSLGMIQRRMMSDHTD